VIADVDLPRRSGIDILMAARGNHWDVPVVLTAADVSPVLRDELIRLGAVAVLKKPLSLPRLEKALALVVEDHFPLRNVPCLGKDPQGGGA
jgi:CheY-like chemotaxis protein